MVYIFFGIILTVFFILFILIDNFTDRLIDWLLGLLGINSGQVELLSIEVKARGERFVLSVKNEGKLGVKLAAVVGIDGEGRKCYPIPYLREEEIGSVTEKHARRNFSKTSIKSNQMIDIFLDGNEIIAKKYKSISILDASGNSKYIPEGI
ncbi:MAG: hypothetical protein VYC70_06665 [Verrucomicrobiota bacterium]|nr:hypothetical protein [Verrucomicrobiota bacterium]